MKIIKDLSKWLLAAVICCLCGCSDPVKMESTIIEKLYVPSKTSTGIGITSSGKSVVMTESSSERYLIWFYENGEVQKMEVDANTFFQLNKGDKFEYWDKWHGRYFISRTNGTQLYDIRTSSHITAKNQKKRSNGGAHD